MTCVISQLCALNRNRQLQRHLAWRASDCPRRPSSISCCKFHCMQTRSHAEVKYWMCRSSGVCLTRVEMQHAGWKMQERTPMGASRTSAVTLLRAIRPVFLDASRRCPVILRRRISRAASCARRLTSPPTMEVSGRSLFATAQRSPRNASIRTSY